MADATPQVRAVDDVRALAVKALHDRFQCDAGTIALEPPAAEEWPHLTAIKTTGPDLFDWQKLTLGEIVDCLADAGLLASSHSKHALCLDVDGEGFAIISDGAEARHVVELSDTLQQVMQERDAVAETQLRADLTAMKAQHDALVQRLREQDRRVVLAGSVHPGEILREELKARGLTQVAFAAMVGRSGPVINQIINGKKTITPDTALDLEQGLGISAEFWVRAQADHDLRVARQRRPAGTT